MHRICFQTVGILSQDGIVRFVNVHTCKLVFEVGSHEKVILLYCNIELKSSCHILGFHVASWISLGVKSELRHSN